MHTVADQFASVLVLAGVERICGIAGDSLNGLTDTICRRGKIEWPHVRHLHVRHEQVAAFAAGAMRSSISPASTFGTNGGGLR